MLNEKEPEAKQAGHIRRSTKVWHCLPERLTQQMFFFAFFCCDLQSICMIKIGTLNAFFKSRMKLWHHKQKSLALVEKKRSTLNASF
jgi:hypothetical protein